MWWLIIKEENNQLDSLSALRNLLPSSEFYNEKWNSLNLSPVFFLNLLMVLLKIADMLKRKAGISASGKHICDKATAGILAPKIYIPIH